MRSVSIVIFWMAPSYFLTLSIIIVSIKIFLYLARENLADIKHLIIPYMVVNRWFITLHGIITRSLSAYYFTKNLQKMDLIKWLSHGLFYVAAYGMTFLCIIYVDFTFNNNCILILICVDTWKLESYTLNRVINCIAATFIEVNTIILRNFSSYLFILLFCLLCSPIGVCSVIL